MTVRDYVARVYYNDTKTHENIEVLARDRAHATVMIEELWPNATVQMVIQRGDW